jgi:hypothetical protein
MMHRCKESPGCWRKLQQRHAQGDRRCMVDNEINDETTKRGVFSYIYQRRCGSFLQHLTRLYTEIPTGRWRKLQQRRGGRCKDDEVPMRGGGCKEDVVQVRGLGSRRCTVDDVNDDETTMRGVFSRIYTRPYMGL